MTFSIPPTGPITSVGALTPASFEELISPAYYTPRSISCSPSILTPGCNTSLISSSKQPPRTLSVPWHRSSDLLAIVGALTYSTSQALSSTHRQSILANADALDAIWKRADGASLTDRAAMACKASQILFGDRAVTSQEPSHTEEQQENWSVAYFSALG